MHVRESGRSTCPCRYRCPAAAVRRARRGVSPLSQTPLPHTALTPLLPLPLPLPPLPQSDGMQLSTSLGGAHAVAALRGRRSSKRLVSAVCRHRDPPQLHATANNIAPVRAHSMPDLVLIIGRHRTESDSFDQRQSARPLRLQIAATFSAVHRLCKPASERGPKRGVSGWTRSGSSSRIALGMAPRLEQELGVLREVAEPQSRQAGLARTAAARPARAAPDPPRRSGSRRWSATIASSRRRPSSLARAARERAGTTTRAAAAPDPAAQLVELGEAEALGVVR